MQFKGGVFRQMFTCKHFHKQQANTPLAAFHSIASYPDSQLLTLETAQSDTHNHMKKIKGKRDVCLSSYLLKQKANAVSLSPTVSLFWDGCWR